jgi:hypothetical protein
LGKSCKNLTSIDISLCKDIDETSLISFLKDSKKLKRLRADHMEQAITDASLEVLSKLKNLEVLSINFCKQVTATGLEFLCEHEF